MALRLTDMVDRLHDTVAVDRIGPVALRRFRLRNVPCRLEAPFDSVAARLKIGFHVELPAAEAVRRLTNGFAVDKNRREGVDIVKPQNCGFGVKRKRIDLECARYRPVPPSNPKDICLICAKIGIRNQSGLVKRMMDTAGNGDRTLDCGAGSVHAGKPPFAGEIKLKCRRRYCGKQNQNRKCDCRESICHRSFPLPWRTTCFFLALRRESFPASVDSRTSRCGASSNSRAGNDGSFKR